MRKGENFNFFASRTSFVPVMVDELLGNRHFDSNLQPFIAQNSPVPGFLSKSFPNSSIVG